MAAGRLGRMAAAGRERKAAGRLERTAARLFAVGAVVAVLGTTSTRALAEPAARLVYLRGKGTESCADEGDLRAAVRTRLGYDPFNSYAASTMFAEVAAVPEGGFSATMKLVDGDNAIRGDRVLKTPGACSELTDAMALTISIAIDPMSVTRNGPPPDAPPEERSVDTGRVEEPAPPPQKTVEPVVEPVAKPTSRKHAVFTLSLGPYASLGSAPALSLGGALEGEVQYGLAAFGAEARAELPASQSANNLGRVSSHMYAGSIYAGVRQSIFFVGALFQLGATFATSIETAVPRDQTTPWIAAGLRLGVAVPLTDRLELRAHADMLANLDRTTLTISGQKAYEYPAISGDLGIAVAVRFP